MGQIEDIQAKRFQFLHRLYELTSGDTLRKANAWEIGNALGFAPDETRQIHSYLRDVGLLGQAGLGGAARLSPEGVRAVEDALRDQNQSTSYFPAINIINIYGDVHHSPIQQGTTDSQQTSIQPTQPRSRSRRGTVIKPFDAVVSQQPTGTSTAGPRDEQEFTDIRIVGFDDQRSRRLPKGVLEAFIELSAAPPTEWLTFLRAECEMPRGTLRRPLQCAEGNLLILHDAYGGSSVPVYLVVRQGRNSG